MNNNSTPGPWSLESNGACFNLRSPDRTEHFLILVGMTHNNPGEFEDNAHLIAAGQDLLAACRKAVEDAAGATNPSARLPNYKAMVAAIAKAEGDS